MRSPLQWLFLKVIRGYQLIVSPHMPPTCRYVPTCSEYGYEAIQRYGALKGGWLATKRIARCNPAVPLDTAETCSTPRNAPSAVSKRGSIGPSDSRPLRSASRTSCSSAGPMAGPESGMRSLTPWRGCACACRDRTP